MTLRLLYFAAAREQAGLSSETLDFPPGTVRALVDELCLRHPGLTRLRPHLRVAVNRQMAATQLPLKPSHVEEILSLPPIHADPFDRALIAQAQAEKLVLVTTDASIARYASSRLRILSQ